MTGQPDYNYDLATGTEDFTLLNHNETDFGAFKDFQASLEAKFSKLEASRSKQERLLNVKKWDSSLPERWRGGSLKTIENDAAKVAERLIHEKRLGSFFIKGEAGVGKTYLSFAIVRRFIGLGLLTPSMVKIISEESLLSIPKLGFAGHTRFEELLLPTIKFYIFDNVGTRDHFDKREGPLWEQLLDHIYTKDLAAIFSSARSAASFAEKLSSPAESKFRHLVDGKIIEMKSTASLPKLDDWSEAELEETATNEKEVGLFDEFKD